MDTLWHYMDNRTPAGPVSEDDLAALLLTGGLTRTSLISVDGIEWEPLEVRLPSLLASAGSPAPPVLPPPVPPAIPPMHPVVPGPGSGPPPLSGPPGPPPVSPAPPLPPSLPGLPDKTAADHPALRFAKDYKSWGGLLVLFWKRFSAGDFCRIQPDKTEAARLDGAGPRLAAFMVWRRALLVLAAILLALGTVKTILFEPLSVQSSMRESVEDTLKKQNPELTSEKLDEQAAAQVKQTVDMIGASNLSVLNFVIVGSLLANITGLTFLILAARTWPDWRTSRVKSGIAAAVITGFPLLTMLLPLSAFMDFGHLPDQMEQTSVVTGIKVMMVLVVLMTALPLFISLFNGVLRASLTAKTLVPSSILCGWGTLTLAIVVAAPWFIVFCLVNQVQADVFLSAGAFLILAAPLSLLLRSRRLGAPLTAEEATTVTGHAKLLFVGITAGGVLLVVGWLLQKDFVEVSQLFTMLLHYLANLMLIQVVALDILARMLARAHRKLADDEVPDAPLRQLAEVVNPLT